MSRKLRLIGTSTRGLLAVLCAVVIAPGDTLAYGLSRQPSNAQAPAPQAEAPIPPEQLDSLVAPIALYPDPLLAQTLAASTYPLEILQLRQWLEKHPGLKDKALADAVEKQPWDPSVQAMAALPDVVTRLANDIQWTTDLGNAVLAQESDVMNAVQRMRQKAMNNGTLKSTPQQVVETTVVESRPAIVIEQADPQVIYVPSYNPTVVYGAPAYPYPSIYYPSAGYYAAGAAISFGVGMAMGAFWGGGGWGWNTGWGRGNINVNNNNFYNRNANIRAGNLNAARTGTWQHAAQHRGNVAYGNRATAQRYGGTARGASTASRQANARQQLNRQGGAVGTSGNRAGQGNLSGQRGNLSGQRTGAGVSNRASGAARGNGNYTGRAGGAGSVGTTGANRGNLGAGGANRGSIGTSGASRGNYGGSGSRGSVGTSGNRGGGSRSMGGGGHRGGGGGSRGGGGRGGGGGGRGGGRR